MKKYNCPDCGKELISLNSYEKWDKYTQKTVWVDEFWCNDCDLEIVVNSHYTSEEQK